MTHALAAVLAPWRPTHQLQRLSAKNTNNKPLAAASLRKVPQDNAHALNLAPHQLCPTPNSPLLVSNRQTSAPNSALLASA